MTSKPSSRSNSVRKPSIGASSQASSSSSIHSTSKKCTTGHSSRASSFYGVPSVSSRANSMSSASSRPSRRSSTDSGESMVSMNESLFSHTGSQRSADSVQSGVIPALYEQLNGLDSLPDTGLDLFSKAKDTRPIAVEEAVINRSGRAGVRQYGQRQIEKRVDNNKLRSILIKHTPRESWLGLSKEYRLRHTNKDPALGTDQLVVKLGAEYGTYTGESSVKYIHGKRSKETRGFVKVADGLGLRPGTLDTCRIKRTRHASKPSHNKQSNALWNAFEDPKTFNKQINATALEMTGGVVGLKGKATIQTLNTSRNTERDIADEGDVNLKKIYEERYLGPEGLPDSKLSRTFMRMPNKLRDLEAMRGFGMQKDKVKITDGEIIRKSQEMVRGRLPKSDEPLESILEDSWKKMTPAKRP